MVFMIFYFLFVEKTKSIIGIVEIQETNFINWLFIEDFYFVCFLIDVKTGQNIEIKTGWSNFLFSHFKKLNLFNALIMERFKAWTRFKTRNNVCYNIIHY